MAISKEKKKEIYAEVSDAVKTSGSIVLFNFHGLTVADATVVRKTLKGKGIGYKIAKKTITKKALVDGGITGTMPELPGELGLAFSKDLTDAAREVYDFQKKLDKKIQILGGVFEGKFMNKEEMLAIALIPSQKTLYGMFVNVINSPIQGLVIALDAIAKKKQA